MKTVEIYTDGSSRGNPGPGGYGALLIYAPAGAQAVRRELSAGYRLTTNNRMELLAVIVALEALREPCRVTVHTDSQYIERAFNERWIDGWRARGWKSASKKPVKNVDLWQRLLKALEPHEVRFTWTRGHAGQPENERCDELATTAAQTAATHVDEVFERERGSAQRR